MSFRTSIELFLLVMMLVCHSVQTEANTTPRLPQTPLSIHTASGAVEFQVELVATPEERKTGLMFRKDLGRNEGMLFDYQENRRVTMWMKNTLISLDILFITAAGKIVRIAADTEPLSLSQIPSGSPVRAVLELRGGTAEFFGIEPGDRVYHEIFSAGITQ